MPAPAFAQPPAVMTGLPPDDVKEAINLVIVMPRASGLARLNDDVGKLTQITS